MTDRERMIAEIELRKREHWVLSDLMTGPRFFATEVELIEALKTASAGTLGYHVAKVWQAQGNVEVIS